MRRPGRNDRIVPETGIAAVSLSRSSSNRKLPGSCNLFETRRHSIEMYRNNRFRPRRPSLHTQSRIHIEVFRAKYRQRRVSAPSIGYRHRGRSGTHRRNQNFITSPSHQKLAKRSRSASVPVPDRDRILAARNNRANSSSKACHRRAEEYIAPPAAEYASNRRHRSHRARIRIGDERR